MLLRFTCNASNSALATASAWTIAEAAAARSASLPSISSRSSASLTASLIRILKASAAICRQHLSSP